MPGVGILLGVILFLVIKMVQSRRAAAPQPAPRAPADWRRRATWLGAVALIIACEVVLPSTGLTGIERPKPVPPAMVLDSMPAPKSLSYADLAEAQPWLWSLGHITRPEMERRIAEDRARLAELGQEFGDISLAGGVLNRRVFGARADDYALLDGVLARLDLDALFPQPGGTVPVSKADGLILARLSAVTETRANEAAEAYTDAIEAQDAYLEAKGLAEGDTADPEFNALRQAMLDASTEFSAESSQRYRIKALLDPVGGARSALNPGETFPQFAQPVTLHSETRTDPLPDDILTGPRGMGLKVAAYAVMDAATGRQRAPSRRITSQTCAVLGAGEGRAPGTRLCEVAVALPVDYDLTGSNCAPTALPKGTAEHLVQPGSRVSDIACKEEWIHPHLHVVYGAGAFTVHAPLPEGIAQGDPQGAPLSLWSATWQGETRNLDPSATFAWNGEDDVLDGLELVHGVRPQVGEPRIWSDFGRDHPGSPLAAITLPGWSFRHGYQPSRLTGFAALKGTEFAPLILAAGGDHAALEAVADWRRPALKSAIDRRETMLNHLARFAVPGQTLDDLPDGGNVPLYGSGCSYYRPALRPVGDDGLKQALLAEVGDVPGGACEAIIESAALLSALDRGIEGGSWLWLAAER